MTDEQAATVMPHLMRLTVAVALGDPDAAATAWAHAVRAADTAGATEPGEAAGLIAFCLADLVTSAEGAALRRVVRTHHNDVPAAIAALTAEGLTP